jgi:hypothetical protein
MHHATLIGESTIASNKCIASDGLAENLFHRYVVEENVTQFIKFDPNYKNFNIWLKFEVRGHEV